MWPRRRHIIPLPLELTKIKQFWEKVIQTISDIIAIGLPVCPWVFIVRLPPELILSGANKKLSFYAHFRLNTVLQLPEKH